MQYVTLGRTGLKVSVLGLGGGGPSRLGTRTGRTEEESAAVIRRAVELDVNFFDTAYSYGTEELMGRVLADSAPRDDIVIATKTAIRDRDGRDRTPEEVIADLETSLRRLRTDRIDVFQLHGVVPGEYDHAVNQIVPALEKARAAGKFRYLGITEAFHPDPGHEALVRALREDRCWDVMMVGFNMINQCARDRVLSHTMHQGIGVLCMFAVRRALTQPDRLREIVDELIDGGLIDFDGLDRDAPLDFLLQSGIASSIADAGYRFCRDEPGIHVVLTGTGRVEHLEANVESIERPSLPPAVRSRLRDLFARVDRISGN